MNPLYTGKDVSFIDTKQANRLAENTLLDAETFATIASLLGARYPDRGHRQGVAATAASTPTTTGSPGVESDQVYLDLLGGWREAWSSAGACSMPPWRTSGPGSTPPGRVGRSRSSTRCRGPHDIARVSIELRWGCRRDRAAG